MTDALRSFAMGVLARGRAGELCPCGREVRGQTGDCGRCIDEKRSAAKTARCDRYRVRLSGAAA